VRQRRAADISLEDHPHCHLMRSLLVADASDDVLLWHEIETLFADQVR
jgi:hypothetical protein